MASKKTKTLDLAPFRTIAAQAVADKDSTETTAAARAQSLREAILAAFPKAKTMTGDDDALKPIRDAYVTAAAIAWCGKVRTSKDGKITYPTDKVLATYSMTKKVRDAQPDDVREGRKVAQGAARKHWFDDVRRAFPEWVKREETAKALKASAPKAATSGEDDAADEETKGAMDADTLRANFRLTVATLPMAEALALIKAIDEDGKGFARALKAGAKVERTVKAA